MQRTHIVGVLVTDLADEFYGHDLRGIEDVAFNGFSVVVCAPIADPDKEIAYVRRLLRQRVDAIILRGIERRPSRPGNPSSSSSSAGFLMRSASTGKEHFLMKLILPMIQ